MPYRLSFEGDLLRLALSGTVTAADFKAFGAEVTQFEAGRAVIPSRLTDLTGAISMDLRYADVATYVEGRKARTFPNSFRSAIVASQSVHIGFARMFQTLNDHPQITIRIFADQETALLWLQGLEAAPA